MKQNLVKFQIFKNIQLIIKYKMSIIIWWFCCSDITCSKFFPVWKQSNKLFWYLLAAELGKGMKYFLGLLEGHQVNFWVVGYEVSLKKEEASTPNDRCLMATPLFEFNVVATFIFPILFFSTWLCSVLDSLLLLRNTWQTSEVYFDFQVHFRPVDSWAGLHSHMCDPHNCF